MAGAARPWVLSRWVTHAALVAVVAAALATPASRASALPRAAASGSVACTRLTGAVTFSPPARDGGSRPEVERFALTATHCTATSAGVTVEGASIAATVRRPTNACAAIFSSAASSGVATWSPASLAPTRFSFSGYELVFAGTGRRSFVVPGPGGTARATGSFAGADHGASSSVAGLTDLTGPIMRVECASAAGVARHRVVSGTVRFG